MVGTDQQQPDLGAGFGVLGQHDRLDVALQRDVQEFRHLLALDLFRGEGLDQVFLGRGALGQQGQRLGGLHVGGVVRGRAVDDGVFAGVGNHMELMRARAADGAVVGRHGAEFQAKAAKDAHVGVVHVLVRLAQAVRVAVEGIGILHGELAPAHDAEARPALVAELGLDLVEIERQLLVAADLAAGDVGHHLFRGRLHGEVALMAVLQAQQFGPHLVPAAGLLPQLGRLDHRHGHFHRAGAVHFLAHDVLHLADHAQPDRHVGVDAGAQLLDHAGAHHQFVRHDFRVGGRFLEGGNEELRGFHP
ncbi:hypothetical protein D9M72_470130 [compost metagenome]